MTRDQLEHLIRAAAVIADDDTIVIVGSQSVLRRQGIQTRPNSIRLEESLPQPGEGRGGEALAHRCDSGGIAAGWRSSFAIQARSPGPFRPVLSESAKTPDPRSESRQREAAQRAGSVKIWRGAAATRTSALAPKGKR
jgi:hypothetical protein